MKRILYDVTNMNDERRTGIGRLTESMVRSAAVLAERGEWDAGELVCVSAWPSRFSVAERDRFRQLGISFEHVPARSMYLYRFFRLPSVARSLNADLVVIPEPTVFPVPGFRRYSVILNDLIYVDDRPSMSFHVSMIYRALADCTLRGAASVAAISAFTRERAGQRLPGLKAKTHVLPMVCDFPHSESSPEVKENFALFVGNLIPRKNIRRLIAVFARWKKESPGEFVPLVVVGKPHPKVDDILPFLREHEANGVIRCAGFVSDEELRRLYRRALFFAFPSLYEGYGLPILEAMFHGCPVLTSKGTATGEAAGGAGLLVDPESEEELLAAMRQLRTDPALRERLCAAGQVRVAELTSERQGRAFCDFIKAGLA